MPTITANGIDIYYEQRGNGRRLLFLNGSGSTLESSAPVIKPFAQRFDLAALDQRGLGRTSAPPGPYTMADYAADARAVLDHLGWDRCRVVGVSFGGMVGQELAATWPERIERLALCCTSPGGELYASYPLHELENVPPKERAAGAIQRLDTRFDAAWLASHPDDRAFAELIVARGNHKRTPDQARGEREQLNARANHDVCDRLPRITCRTLVAGGRFDGIAPLPNSEYIAAHVPDAELRVYEGGHAFFVQDPKALPEILDFLDEP